MIPGGERYYDTADDAMAGPMEPNVPCDNMETRPCVDITGEWDARRFRRVVCPVVCVRFGVKIDFDTGESERKS